MSERASAFARALALTGRLALAGGACAHAPPPAVAPAGTAMVDAAATAETRALFLNLRDLAREHVLFGHQSDLAYGVTWVAQPGRSDVKESSGSYPAVYGWDVADLFVRGPGPPTPEQRERMLRDWILEGYRRGGVATFSWHMANPVSGGNAWDTTRAVAAILPGGARHELYREWLDRFAAFAGTLRVDGRLVPLIFRPYHEMTGSWFWWGGRNATPDEYRALWRFTVGYLRDVRGVHNLIWAYSTDVFDAADQYLRYYPGDAYVDVLGFDDYHSVRSPATRAVFARRLRTIVELAEARGKIAALTETGLVTIPDPNWFTGTLLDGIRSDPVGRRIAWVLVWRNANGQVDVKDHFYAPYPGHPSVPDFIRFRNDPQVLFEDELPDLYSRRAR